MTDLETYLKEVNFDKQYENLVKKYGGKKVVIYGAGQLFKVISSKYDLSVFRIKGLSDKKFFINPKEEPVKEYMGYPVISPGSLSSESFDVLLIGTLEYYGLVLYFKKQLKNENVKVEPLVKETFSYFLRQIFSK